MNQLEQLTEKMTAEFETLRAWLLTQPPEEILDHTFEYTTKQDIVMSAENIDLTPAQVHALLASPSPLEDVYNDFSHIDFSEYNYVLRLLLEQRADIALEKLRTAPVYTQTPDYAREHAELDEYRESNRLNVLCKEAIEQAVRDNYRDNRLDADAVWRDVTAQFGAERTAFVLAMTVQEKVFDGRFSRDNKAWAKSQRLPPDPEHRGRYCSYVVDKAHPILTDALITHARRELERKPSVMEKLQSAEKPPKSTAKAAVPEL